MLEDALRNGYNVQSGGKRGILSGFCIVRVWLEGWTGSWPRWRSWRNLQRQARQQGSKWGAFIEGDELQSLPKARAYSTNCLERQCFKCQGWGHEAVSCSSKVPTPKENGDKEKKDESAVMAVSPEPDSEVAAETKLDEINGGTRPV